MDHGVAIGARRQFRRSGGHPVNPTGGDRAMALIAQRVDTRHVQQPGVLRAVWSVATQAPLCLDSGMLIDERPARLRVALSADRILVGRRPQVAVHESAVGVVAVTALDQTFVHPVMERHIEGRLDVRVTLET
jgi:hypothetical protein